MSRIPEHFIDELLDRLDIVSIIGQRVALQKAGTEYKACCPFHDEKSPSFTVSPQKQFYHCFGCGAHGTALGFVMNYDGLAFVDAVKELAHSVGMQVPVEAGQQARQASPERAQEYDALEKAAAFYQQQLRDNRRALDYLSQRGLNEEIISTYQIGYAPDAWRALLEYCTSCGINEKALHGAGLLAEKNGRVYDKFRHRIQFPIHDRRGRVIGFGGRALDDNGPKYLNSPETSVFHKGYEVYGLYQARQRRKPDQLIVTEGYMDVVALSQYQVEGAVATLGTATTEHQVRLLFQASDNVVCCFDGDRAGVDAAWKALKNMLPQLQAGRQVNFLFLPQGDDPDSMIRRVGLSGWSEAVAAATPLSEYLFTRLEDGLNLNTVEGRASLVVRAEPLLKQLPSGPYREQMQQILHDKTRQMVTFGAADEPSRSQTKGSYKRLEKTPLRQLAAMLVQAPFLATELDSDALEVIKQQKNAINVLELIDFCQQRPQIHTNALLERWSAHAASRLLAEVATWPFADEPDVQKSELRRLLQMMQAKNIAVRIDVLITTQQQSGLNAEQKNELRQLLLAKQRLQTPPVS